MDHEQWKALKKSRQRIEPRPRMKTWVGRIKYWDAAAGKWTRTRSVDLLSDDEQIAQARYDHWFATGELPDAGGSEPFEVAARRIVGAALAAGKANAKDRIARLERHAFSRIGWIAVKDLKQHHVAAVLDGMMEDGLLGGAILKMRSDISRVLAPLARRGAVSINVAKGVELHEDVEDDCRERLSLSDEETIRFRRHRGFHRELDMMCLHARDLAAHRTSDLHAEDWTHWDLEDFATCRVRRPKTDDEPDARGRTRRGRRKSERGGRRRQSRSYQWVEHTVSPLVAKYTRLWWQAQGCPRSGPVFPVRKGPRAGERKGKGTSYCQAYRDAVWEAGIHRPLPGFERAVGEQARRALDAYQTDTDTTRALDFHGIRAAAITALCEAGVSDLLLGPTVGHTQPKTSAGYVRRIVVGMPEAALPGGGIDPLAPPPAEPLPAPPAPAPAPAHPSVLEALWSAVGAPEGPSPARGQNPVTAQPLAKVVGQKPPARGS